ncbi:hypothetical protein WAX74_11320 [Psychrobacillus sp. FJAT-51614]|uniref:Uncharacterized protein n=1 Tax=Psychrobacillus mangrovi TaxID=3117745 RepID=A0ABU8F5C2_9BACI
MFIGVGITLSAMIGMLYSKKIDAIFNWSILAVKADGLLPFSTILILLPGFYLVITSWGWGTAWINISLTALVAMIFLGPIINLRRLKAILEIAKNEYEANITNPSTELVDKIRDRVLWNSISTMTMLAFAIVFLMTVKLEILGSLITIAIAFVLGFIVPKLLLKTTKHLA